MFHFFMIVLLFDYLSNGSTREAKGEVTYDIGMLGAFEMCPNYPDLTVDLANMAITQDTPTTTILNGDFIILEDIVDGTQIQLVIEKETPAGKELALLMEDDLCSHLAEEDMPWTSFVKSLDLKGGCPIPAKTYKIRDMSLDLDFVKSVKKKEFEGDYSVKILMVRPGEGLDITPDTFSCVLIGVTITETRKES